LWIADYSDDIESQAFTASDCGFGRRIDTRRVEPAQGV
jgi:hypothetical protein